MIKIFILNLIYYNLIYNIFYIWVVFQIVKTVFISIKGSDENCVSGKCQKVYNKRLKSSDCNYNQHTECKSNNCITPFSLKIIKFVFNNIK